eukprot:3500410-Amphidinium_carterae.1
MGGAVKQLQGLSAKVGGSAHVQTCSHTVTHIRTGTLNNMSKCAVYAVVYQSAWAVAVTALYL